MSNHFTSLRVDTQVHVVPIDGIMFDGDTLSNGHISVHPDGFVKNGKKLKCQVKDDDLDIGEVIGRGASSIVCHAYHRKRRTEYALKIINIYDRSKQKHIIKEIDALYDAQCECLIEFYGAFVRDGTLTIVLEYMNGGSLENVLNQVGPIPEKPLAAIVWQAASGMKYLKSIRRIHRDIKPSNLLINSDGKVKITDFGISTELEDSMSTCGTFVGTYKYMSPERILSDKYTYSSDIWSLGLVVYECATGDFPFKYNGSLLGIIEAIVEGETPQLALDDFSIGFRQLVERCLQKNPRSRPKAESLIESDCFICNGVRNHETATSFVLEWINN